jgi:hypothetical protein
VCPFWKAADVKSSPLWSSSSVTLITNLVWELREFKLHGARPVHLIITMIKRIWTSRLSIDNSHSLCSADVEGAVIATRKNAQEGWAFALLDSSFKYLV